MGQIIPLKRSIIPSCDTDLLDYRRILESTVDLEKVGAYKIGLELGLRYGLPRVVELAWQYTGKPLIYDHQKAGTDTPDTAGKFARIVRDAGFDAVILFLQAGPKTEEAWIKAGEVRPLNSTSFNNLADLYTNFTKEYDKAESVFFVTVKNSSGEPQNPGFYRNFYSFYIYNLEDLNKAEAILLEAITVNPNAAELYALLGYFYRDEKGNDAKAIEYFEKNLILNSSNDQVKKDLDKLR